jgi:hypothetical protein
MLFLISLNESNRSVCVIFEAGGLQKYLGVGSDVTRSSVKLFRPSNFFNPDFVYWAKLRTALQF